ncbi:MAG: proline dehydrogenase family protein, partial [Pseudomonadota bacterium]
MTRPEEARTAIADGYRRDQQAVLLDLMAHAPSPAVRAAANARAVDLVDAVRRDTRPGMMEVFLAEYGLSSKEGIALMCLAEALLRVPDAPSLDALIEDKIAASAWSTHLGKSSSPLVNASTWALLLTGKVLEEPTDSIAGVLHSAVRRLGEPVIRAAVSRAMQEMGEQFVLGQTIEAAMKRAAKWEEQGFTYSYDMLGEAAMTAGDASDYYAAYEAAIAAIGARAHNSDVRNSPGISIKLSALHPRYEETNRERALAELVPRVVALAGQARAAGIGLNIDAEEADRLELSLDVIAATLEALPSNDTWDGFGVVVQAYGRRAGDVIDWLTAMAERDNRRLMVRLVKGAYWDTEIKQAQVGGAADYPVFTDKPATDVAYICCADKLLANADRLYPQFATHNAHTIASVLELAKAHGRTAQDYEFQRLHGMGETVHRLVKDAEGTRARIYAPVGAHRDLLAYLVRRLLENGANSSFVNQIVDEEVPPAVVAADPFERIGVVTPDTQNGTEGEARQVGQVSDGQSAKLPKPPQIFAPRLNSRGWDVNVRADWDAYARACAPFA